MHSLYVPECFSLKEVLITDCNLCSELVNLYADVQHVAVCYAALFCNTFTDPKGVEFIPQVVMGLLGRQ